MNTKIYYLTRSYSPYQKGGGPLMRTGAVKYLQELGWDVTVVMPNYNSRELIIENNVIQIPFKNKHIEKLASVFERIGVYEDYLDKWIDNAFKYLKSRVKQEDILFSTSGGELGMIKLGSVLKKEIACKFIVNFRDPLDYSLVNGLKIDKKFHIGREKQEYKYLRNSDLIITSSKAYQTSLQNKYPFFKDKIKNNYFGYIEKIDLNLFKKKEVKRLKVAYVGSMSRTQKPEILYQLFQKLYKKKDIEIYFIGNSKNYMPLQNIHEKNIHFIDFLPHNEFLKFMAENIDVGFVSLANDYLGACVPSKIYEYINLRLPMIGALPDGDGKDIINQNGYGIACKYDDFDGLIESLERFRNVEFLSQCKCNLIKDREEWSMKTKIKEVDKWLREIYAN